MSRWLSEAWFGERLADADDRPERPGVDGRLQLEVTGGPDGDVAAYWVLADGRPVGGGPGRTDGADVTLTAAWSDAVAMERGELDPNVAYMQGRLKVAGSMGLVLELLPLARTPEDRERRRQAAGLTEF
jgi:hypothetical protein